MDFTTILFGNGLGRAIDNQYFDLGPAITEAWNSTWRLTDNDKQAILGCLPGNPQEINIEEGHLELLHEVASACKLINAAVGSPRTILAEAGAKLPASVNRLVSRVGYYFHSYTVPENCQFETFCKKLALYIKTYYVHVATLNYDNVLYNSLIDAKILNGYRGHLIDGFTKDGGVDLTFENKNLDRIQERLGFYLHLHGSPLFISKNGKVIKQTQGVHHTGYEPHMVLHHINQKRAVISGSELLNSYWQRFDQALLQSRCMILFGYGGFDLHINDLIASRKNDVNFGDFDLVIVEWIGSGTRAERKRFWSEKLSTSSFKLIQMDNILEFDFGT